ncbi:MAG: serine/threonine protein kinase [Acidobacteria bacterium]|nr:serine/threonine protein kinase [Acidobacteriota bacterium]
MQDWRRIEELFQAALALPKDERIAFVHQSCAGDEALRTEVQGLLEGVDSADGFLEGTPLGMLTPPSEDLSAGTMLGRFQVMELVGRGGMGEVYKAHDTRLGRTVALKICRRGFSERFEREARAIATLSHPHICTLYDVGPNYLVMELIQGQPLAGPLPVETALRYAVQAADALRAAHKQGVVHRDFKPGNVLVTAAGVKLVDFGLARMIAPGATGGDDLTLANQIPGTLRYISPEQLEGKPADVRSDLFAFGLVLQETITGTPVFAVPSQAGLISAILKDEPPPLTSPKGQVPPALVRLVRKCLAKDPEARWQTAADLHDELQWILQMELAPAARPAAPIAAGQRRRALVAGSLGALALLAAAGLGWRQWTGGTHTAAGMPASGLPVVVLMDTAAPSGVYDPETRSRAETNADDLTEALRNLPLALHKETAGATWNREEQLANQRPSLILIHRSIFVHSLVFEFDAEAKSGAHKKAWPIPSEDDQFYRRLSRIGRDKLDALLGYLAAANPQTRFIVYARDWSEASRKRWMEGLAQRFPGLQGRVIGMELQPVAGVASFRQAPNIAEIRKAVSAMLGKP